MDTYLEVPDIIIFLGRFHPLVVHLPIGILLLGALMHFTAKFERYSYLDKASTFSIAVGAFAAIFACILGYMLSLQGGYNQGTLDIHQWMGIGVAITASIVAVFKIWKKTCYLAKVHSAGLLLVLGALTITGHIGGNLTHGSTYLTQYAPESIRKVIGLPPKPVPRPPVATLDSADIFLDIIHPMLETHCVTCHNQDKAKGQLVLTTYAEIIKGGKHGPSVIANDATASELYRRITLPRHHDEFMPTEGKTPLTQEQVGSIKYWIDNGSLSTAQLAHLPLTDSTRMFFNSVLGLTSNLSALAPVTPADENVIQALKEQGYIVKNVSESSNWLTVSLPFGKVITSVNISDLLQVSEQLYSLDLNRCNLQDNDLMVIGQLENLKKLKIDNNPITDKGALHLSPLKELEHLNMYATQVRNESISLITSLGNLKSVFLWQTQVDSQALTVLQNERPGLIVNVGEN